MKEASGPAKTTKAGWRCCYGHASPKAWYHVISGVWSGESLNEKHLGSLVDRCIFLSVHDQAYTTALANLHPHWVPAPVRVSWSPPGVGNWVWLSAVKEQGLRTQHSNVTAWAKRFHSFLTVAQRLLSYSIPTWQLASSMCKPPWQ